MGYSGECDSSSCHIHYVSSSRLPFPYPYSTMKETPSGPIRPYIHISGALHLCPLVTTEPTPLHPTIFHVGLIRCYCHSYISIAPSSIIHTSIHCIFAYPSMYIHRSLSIHIVRLIAMNDSIIRIIIYIHTHIDTSMHGMHITPSSL